MITEADIDQEMVARGWARVVLGGFIGGDLVPRVVAKTNPDGDYGKAGIMYLHRRDKVRADLIRKAKGARSGPLDAAEGIARTAMAEGSNKSAAARHATDVMAKRGIAISVKSLRNRLKIKRSGWTE